MKSEIYRGASVELPRVGSSCSSMIGSQGGTQFGVIGVQHLREAWGWACTHLIALFAQICFTHNTHTLKKYHSFFCFWYFFYRGKNTLGVRLTVRRVRRALIRPVTSGPIALFNLSSSSLCWEVGRLTTPTTTTSAAPSPPTPLLLSRRLTSCHLRHFEPNRNLT